jgi:acetyl esterase
MAGMSRRISTTAQARIMRTLYAMPAPARRRMAGRQIRIDGQTLDPDAQLLLKLRNVEGGSLSAPTPQRSRDMLRRGAELSTMPGLGPVQTRDMKIGEVPVRLYTPVGLAAGAGLLVFYHGGGWVIGDLETHHDVCRYLATEAGVRVLSVAYRLAPESPFPAGVQDAVTAFRYAVEHAGELDADPVAIGVSGDSAGGNLAAVVCHVTATEHTQRPAFSLLFYPAVDASVRRRSRELFGEGFFLTEQDILWFRGHYAPDASEHVDPRLSVLLSDHLADFPPTYLTVGGFDPLRDEVLEFGDALGRAGVPVVTRVHPDLIHGFANFGGIVPRAREAMAEAVGALRTGLAFATAGARRVG